ncbi:DUF1376 domain-containing protein [Mesorhizobium sp. B2-8-3]|uniref:DUF1376 domain-containing protein n=1 Tax=Mesorhizobium sp. B2-8-3 TaxID=2589905 RepID=UPI002484BABA|nr:DUF1376 domain-containing protein [Mesorhizobium sp. B2-8-3]
MPYFRCFVGKWKDIVDRMSTSETATYLKLTLLMFQRGEPLPENTERLSRQCQMSRKLFASSLDQLIEEGVVIRTHDGLWSALVEEEFKFRNEVASTKANAANRRWEKRSEINGQTMHQDRNSNAGAMLKEETIRENREDAVASSNAAKGQALELEFGEWWALYPNKIGKPAALKSFIAARKKVDAETLVLGLRSYINSKPIDRAWCNPTTWLNQERWDDRPANVASVPTGRTSLPAAKLQTVGDWASHRLRELEAQQHEHYSTGNTVRRVEASNRDRSSPGNGPFEFDAVEGHDYTR